MYPVHGLPGLAGMDGGFFVLAFQGGLAGAAINSQLLIHIDFYPVATAFLGTVQRHIAA